MAEDKQVQQLKSGKVQLNNMHRLMNTIKEQVITKLIKQLKHINRAKCSMKRMWFASFNIMQRCIYVSFHI